MFLKDILTLQTAFRNFGWSTTYLGAVSYKKEVSMKSSFSVFFFARRESKEAIQDMISETFLVRLLVVLLVDEVEEVDEVDDEVDEVEAKVEVKFSIERAFESLVKKCLKQSKALRIFSYLFPIFDPSAR